MDEQALRVAHTGDDFTGGGGLDNRQRLGIAPRRNEGQHHHVRVAVEENIFDKIVGTDATHVLTADIANAIGATAFQRPREARRHHVMALNVENKLTAAQLLKRESVIERGLRGNVEEAGAEQFHRPCATRSHSPYDYAREAVSVRIRRCWWNRS